MGENVNRVLDCEKVTMLLTIEQQSRIEESIEVEIGNIIHEVHVRELGFVDTSVDPIIKIVDPKDKDKTSVTEEQLESLSEKDQGSQVVDVDARGSFCLEEDAFNAKWLERGSGNCTAWETDNFDAQINEDELVGTLSKEGIATDKSGLGGADLIHRSKDSGLSKNVEIIEIDGAQKIVTGGPEGFNEGFEFKGSEPRPTDGKNHSGDTELGKQRVW
ncbi:hypothetical protein V6N11_073203 [Hibiscus sabdariffa]|uniref:Uncharacterized protein n=1 Tax=Hibiscus sabdariffa TaxID=183260 RepID=A0ABR2A5W3_9ROSI